MRLSATNLLACLLLSACRLPAPEGITFEATVTNTSQEAITYGHVLVYDAENGKLISSMELDGSGRFRITAPSPSLEPRYVRVVSPYHQEMGFPMIVRDETPRVVGKVVLASNVIRDPDHVQLEIGGDSVGEMERRSDGAFVYRLDEPEETVVYSVTGASVDGRPLPGNGQIRLVARDRSRPFYEAVIENPYRPLEVVYSQSHLLKADPGAESRMVTSSATLEAVLAILRERSRGAKAIGRKMRASEEPQYRQAMAVTFDLVLEALESDTKELRTYAAAEMMDYYLKEVATDRDRQRAAQLLPVESPSWRWVRSLESIPPTYLGPYGEEVFEALAARNSDRRVRAFAVAALARAAKDEGDAPDWARRYAELEEYADLGEPVAYLLKRLDPGTKIVEGNPVPPFTVALTDGTYRGSDVLSDRALSGVAYVLQFWGTWCTPCVAEMPELHALWQRYGGPDFQMVSLSVEDSREAVERFRKDLWPMPWLHVVLEGEAGREIVDLLEVTSYPTTILVGRSGVIVSLKDPDEGLAKDVETLLGLAGESG